MIFGFNTDVQGRDALYHVQTEDRGQRNPVVESIIYVGGKILGKKRTSYDPATFGKEQVEEAVRHQHKELMEAIRNGTWTPPLPAHRVAESFAPASVQNSPNGEVGADVGGGTYDIELTNPSSFQQGEYFRFQLAVRNGTDRGHAGEVGLDVRWLVGGRVSDEQSLNSRADGGAEVWVSSPESTQSAALVIRARGSLGSTLRKFVLTPTA